ncbi:MAG: hypothetical protein GY765_30140, partial [bacterium]|nr:hypothetical protein [bacterium]
MINAGRDEAALHNIVGFFVNSVIFKIKLHHEEPFREFLKRVNRDLLEIFSHQGYPLELVFDDLNQRYPEIPV